MSAYWIGSRMSGGPICAMTDPSRNSTIECTIDCGWMTTRIDSAGVSKSQRASTTSSALFMSVAESIEIFGPMRHVGWFRASALVIDAKRVSRAAAGTARRSR